MKHIKRRGLRDQEVKEAGDRPRYKAYKEAGTDPAFFRLLPPFCCLFSAFTLEVEPTIPCTRQVVFRTANLQHQDWHIKKGLHEFHAALRGGITSLFFNYFNHKFPGIGCFIALNMYI